MTLSICVLLFHVLMMMMMCLQGFASSVVHSVIYTSAFHFFFFLETGFRCKQFHCFKYFCILEESYLQGVIMKCTLFIKCSFMTLHMMVNEDLKIMQRFHSNYHPVCTFVIENVTGVFSHT